LQLPCHAWIIYLSMTWVAARCGAVRSLHRFGALTRSTCLFAGRSLTRPVRRPKLAQKEALIMDLDPRNLDELARKLSESVPPGLVAVRDDLERNFKAVLQSGLSRLELVTRQEFDVQAGVLRRTRERLEKLETRLAALEATQPRTG
jgi:BMFP domain-containing protein YqiC